MCKYKIYDTTLMISQRNELKWLSGIAIIANWKYLMFDILSIKHKFGPLRFHGGRRASAKLSFVVAAAWDKKLKLTWRELLLHHTWLVVCIIVVK